MNQANRLFVGALLAGFTCFGTAGVASAQDKGKDAKAAPAAPPVKAEKGSSTVKIILENEKVRAQEVTYKPGDENKTVSRYNRVVRALTAGTLQRTWPDGKTDKVEFKVGDVIFNPAVAGTAV